MLEKVKKRLRAEQVEREKAASARHRRQEEKQLQQGTDSKVRTSACQCSVLLVLSLCCILLSLAVLVLSSVVLRILKLG